MKRDELDMEGLKSEARIQRELLFPSSTCFTSAPRTGLLSYSFQASKTC